ncbi:phospholipase D-like domain-containing protein [Pantoea agglomerans]|uniref:phospholipase D-like domain-containing protein n=1 Tax=Enterobacter agglomerans TaxID=549 RepID=UPI00320A3BD8
MNNHKARVMMLSAIAFIPRSFATVTAGFSPGGTALNLILQFAGSARQSVDVAAYDFASQPVAQALAASVARGVTVRLVADEKKSRDRWSLVSALVITGEPATARQYRTEFNRLWNESSPVACSADRLN